MDFSTLRQRVADRGFDYLSQTKRGELINQGYHWLCEQHAWPFLRTTTTGTAPLSISDLRHVLYVVDSTNDQELYGEDERTIRDNDPDLAQTGNPQAWYLTSGPTLNVWPPNTSSSLTVVYLEVPTDLSSDSDTPVIPTRYHPHIVDAAVVEAYRDSDNAEAAEALLASLYVKVGHMVNTLMTPNYQNPDTLVTTAGYSTDW